MPLCLYSLSDRAKKSTSRGWGHPLYMMAAQGPITLGNYFMATLNEAEKRIKRVLIFIRSSPGSALRAKRITRPLFTELPTRLVFSETHIQDRRSDSRQPGVGGIMLVGERVTAWRAGERRKIFMLAEEKLPRIRYL